MGKTGLLVQFAAGALVVATTAGGGLLTGGVANAASSVAPPAMSAVSITATTTELIVVPKSFPEGLPVSLVAIVTPRAAAGTVQFKEGNTNIGGPVAVQPADMVIHGIPVDRNSSAAFTLTSTLAVGTHSLTAVFTPTDQAVYSSSTSTAESLTVTPPIITGLPISIDSLLKSVLGGLPGGPGNTGPTHLRLDLPPGLGGLVGGAAGLDPGQIIESVLGGLL